MRWPDYEYDASYCGCIPETQVQAETKRALELVGFTSVDLSQGRETQQTEGIPDLFVAHPTWVVAAWIEIKVPQLTVPGVRPGTTRILQRQGKWRWQQETLHAVFRAAGQHVITVDHAGEALAYFASLGYPVPREMYRTPYDPAAQERFRDPHAEAAWLRAEVRKQSSPRRTQGSHRKRGPRLGAAFQAML
jgi:hypothetical protein